RSSSCRSTTASVSAPANVGRKRSSSPLQKGTVSLKLSRFIVFCKGPSGSVPFCNGLLAAVSIETLLLLPHGPAFLDECRDSFLGIALQGVGGHDCAGLLIGIVFVQGELVVKGRLAQAQDRGTRSQESSDIFADGGVELIGCDDAVDQP